MNNFDNVRFEGLIEITKLAINKEIPLEPLWEPGGGLYDSFEGYPPRLPRKSSMAALKRLKDPCLERP